jgi:hypothetical protein
MERKNVFRRIRDWFTLADYDDEKEKATERVVQRFARGNVCVQNGWFIDDTALADLSKRGDKAVARLRRLSGRVAAYASSNK